MNVGSMATVSTSVRLGRSKLVLAAVVAFGLSWTGVAGAEPMDLALERLVLDESCRSTNGEALVGADGQVVGCAADNDAFKRLVNQYGMALSPAAMYPAKTTGYAGFEFGVEGVITSANSQADYLRLGTRGSSDPMTGEPASENDAVPSVFQVYSLRVRKGFVYGLEVGLSLGFLTSSSIFTGGLDLRWALLEGFRTEPLKYIPEFALMGSVRTITGSPQLDLSVMSFGGVLSKELTVSPSAVLTPWLGYQYLWLLGDSQLIDFTPGTNSLDLCNEAGPRQPGFADGPEPADGSPVCGTGGVSGDENNTRRFASARLERQRLIVGASYRYDYLVAAAQAMLEIVPPSVSQADTSDSQALEGESAQFALGVQVGVRF